MALAACRACQRLISDRAAEGLCRQCRYDVVEDALLRGENTRQIKDLSSAIRRGIESGSITPTAHYTSA